jgi:hypothetical protein
MYKSWHIIKVDIFCCHFESRRFVKAVGGIDKKVKNAISKISSKKRMGRKRLKMRDRKRCRVREIGGGERGMLDGRVRNKLCEQERERERERET